MKIRQQFPEIKDPDTRKAIEEIARTASEVEEEYVDVEFPAKDVEVKVPIAGFASVPDDIRVATPSTDFRIYRGDSEWTNQEIYLKCTDNLKSARIRVIKEPR